VTKNTSLIWLAPIQGSVQIMLSPGSSVSGG
jgi:hypothetical protein